MLPLPWVPLELKPNFYSILYQCFISLPCTFILYKKQVMCWITLTSPLATGLGFCHSVNTQASHHNLGDASLTVNSAALQRSSQEYHIMFAQSDYSLKTLTFCCLQLKGKCRHHVSVFVSKIFREQAVSRLPQLMRDLNSLQFLRGAFFWTGIELEMYVNLKVFCVRYSRG